MPGIELLAKCTNNWV